MYIHERVCVSTTSTGLSRSFRSDMHFTRVLPGFNLVDDYVLRFQCELKVARTGIHTFRTFSDDGSRLYIDRLLVVDNDGLHSPRV